MKGGNERKRRMWEGKAERVVACENNGVGENMTSNVGIIFCDSGRPQSNTITSE